MAFFFKIDETHRIPISRDEAWEFFSDPGKLLQITPPSIKLRITSENSAKIYPGMIITYRLTPLPGFRVQWLTEIVHVAEKEMFTDEQKLGPYSYWHHQHFFTEIKGGVAMRDVVHYALPFGFLGAIVHGLIVKRQLNNIFRYRRDAIKRIFGEYKVA